MMKKHVVIIQFTTLAENYGLSTYLRNIVNFLSKKNNLKVSAIVLKGKFNKENCPQNIDLYEISGSTYSLKDNIKFIKECYKTLKSINSKSGIDTIHCLYPNSSVFASILYKIFSKKINLIYDLRSPWLHVSVERGSIGKSFVPIYLFVGYLSEFINSFFVDKYIFITKGLYDFYKNRLYLSSKPLRIIPSGIDTKIFGKKYDDTIRLKYGVTNRDFLLGYVGAISTMRDLNIVIEAIRKLDKNSNIKFMLVGDGDAAEGLKKLAKESKLEDKIIFTGKIPHQDVPKYMSSFDAGICQLRDTFVFRQSFPMKILEYLATGIPVLASNLKAHEEISSNFKDVIIYIDVDDLKNILANIKKVKKQIPKSLRAYDWTNITDEIYTFY